jgi:hypothetical protein
VSLRSRKPNPELAISEHELSTMTVEMDELHHDVAMPAMVAKAGEWAEENRALATEAEVGLLRRATSRRTFLLGGSAVLGGLALAACSSSTTSSATAKSTTTTAPLSTPLKAAALAASLENLAVATYSSAIHAATAGKLGTVPPAVVTFAETARKQHKDHAAAWNSILTGAGKSAVSGPDPVLAPVVKKDFAKVTDVTGVAKLALDLELIAAATYLEVLDDLSYQKAIEVAATIQPVEMQHAAILNFVLGQYPVPDAFARTEGVDVAGQKYAAVPVSSYQGNG